MPSSARMAAFDILRQVEAGGYASDLLLTHTGALDSRARKAPSPRRFRPGDAILLDKQQSCCYYFN